MTEPRSDTMCFYCREPIEYNEETDEWYHVDTWQHSCPVGDGFARPD